MAVSDNDSASDIEGEEDAGNPQAADGTAAGNPWQAVLDAKVPAIVALHVTAVRSFQDDHAGAHGGTGFVVDAERGLLLTNRHVCTCGPARARATFVGSASMEEVTVSVAYLDPVHDFAILRFDPSELRQTPRAEIELDPQGCRVGEEVRVVGNDSLEKLQILSGTIARIDRDPPELSGDFADENTFYAMAASGTRGGSSGSPVLNSKGKAIALNAAAVCGTMHGFYLPLHRIARALESLRSGAFVTRGTLCTQLSYTSFPECHRFGVTKEFIKESVVSRTPQPGGTFTKSQPPSGMLQVKRCMPGTAADDALKPGDILLELEGKPCVDFVFFDAVLDSSVGKTVKIVVCRGGARIDLQLQVIDLHNLIPHAFMELGLGVFHGVPYQTAQKHNVPMRGVYVAQAGFVFGESVKSDAVILELNGAPCNDLQCFEQGLAQVEENEYFSVSWMVPKNVKERRRVESFVKMQRQWFPFRAWSLDYETRVWTPRRLTAPSAITNAESSASAPDDNTIEPAQLKEPPVKKRKSNASGALLALDKCICSVVFRTVQNFNVDLVADMSSLEKDVYVKTGCGIVVEADGGFVLTDRATVPQPLGDIEVGLGDMNRSASVWFMHPDHSIVILKVDAPAPGESKSFGTSAKFVDFALDSVEEALDFVGVDDEGRRAASKVNIRRIALADFPKPFPPRWHERNLEAVTFDDDPANMHGGVICSEAGDIYAMYATAPVFEDGEMQNVGYALPSYVIMPLLEHLRGPNGLSAPPLVPTLEIQLRLVELSKFRRLPAKHRPPAQWLQRLTAASVGEVEDGAKGGWALQVAGVTSGGPCDGLVAQGDLLVAVADDVVATARAVEERLREASIAAMKELSGTEDKAKCAEVVANVKLTLLRASKARTVDVRVPLLDGDGAKRLLCWNGLMLEETPRSVREYGAVPAGVHISDMLLGSPGEADAIEGEFLLAVGGTPTPTLDALLATDRKQAEASGDAAASARCHVRVETADMSGRRFVKALEPDPLYWPTTELALNSNGKWSCIEHSA
eukprot:TRINITY_DN14545_c0_g9_i1.p1 TRINITY_DN14545_c0_g9~~TRINITY_DN14545_c0_g9_i1.p1  ORF type:complete len:1031 (-),score=181.43 TRINITY_DN14545_c0_g9_i1:141-3233(-)